MLTRVTCTGAVLRLAAARGLAGRARPGDVVSFFDDDDVPASVRAVLVVHYDRGGAVAWVSSEDRDCVRFARYREYGVDRFGLPRERFALVQANDQVEVLTLA
jgi:hypothetical protein